MQKSCFAAHLLLPLILTNLVLAAEVTELTEKNWDEFAPDGKEVDCIYGDYVLQSDLVVAVIARPGPLRNANMTVRNVGGALIDLTRREPMSDQLSAFYPHAGRYEISGPIPWSEAFPNALDEDDAVARIAFSGTRTSTDGETDSTEIFVGYQLRDAADYLTLISRVRNTGEQPTDVTLADGVRADGEFDFGFDEGAGLWWARDVHWEQAYGVRSAENDFRAAEVWSGRARDPRRIRFHRADGSHITLPPGGELTLRRQIIPGRSDLEVRSIARRLAGTPDQAALRLGVTGAAGPVSGAFVEVLAKDQQAESWGIARTNDAGSVRMSLPTGVYNLVIRPYGRAEKMHSVSLTGEGATTLEKTIRLDAPGYVVGQITDALGNLIPCKVAFDGIDGTSNPNFGPDSGIRGVRNLHYTPNGRLRVEVEPGTYSVVISHGPEFDAEIRDIKVVAGQETSLDTQLARVVDSSGWLSADFHGHSSPSGDNTSSQRGRVLNLLAEHIEFGPCTEHNRISTYVPHLVHFQAEALMATCCGMELTGQPLPINHQNAFPLRRYPRLQGGGAPVTDINPVVQIERLALWDSASDKLVQINHPNIFQMVGDRDLDGTADGGFERMFAFTDVMEVHPPADIFKRQTELRDPDDERGNQMFNWLQLLNLGYRVPGVVNTDAHWNYHGSGWLRNYIRSSTDDPAEVKIEDLVLASQRGQIVMTNGPFLSVEAESSAGRLAGPGDDLSAPGGKLRLRVRVECANWLDVNRVQVFVNGRPEERHNYERRRFGEMFQNGPVIFDQELQIALQGDAHLVVATIGDGGRLGRVFGEEAGTTEPVAVANPVFVDVDGDGFVPNGDMLGLPLPVPEGHVPSHGHAH